MECMFIIIVVRRLNLYVLVLEYIYNSFKLPSSNSIYVLVFLIPINSFYVHQTNVALDVIKKGETSAAIFAPGWVYETQQRPNFQTAQSR